MFKINVSANADNLNNLLPAAENISAYTDFEHFFYKAALSAHALPQEIHEAFYHFTREHSPEAGLFLYGLPTDIALPPTPISSQDRIYKTTYASEFWLCCIASLLGEPVAYIQEKQGSIFHNIFPTPTNAYLLSSESSAIDLDFHTEIAFHPFLPDYLLLYGLRQDPEKGTITSFTSVRRILNELSTDLRDILFEPLFKTGIDYSFGSPNGAKGNGPVLSVLYGDQQDPFLRFDSDLMIGTTDEAQQALDELKRIIPMLQESVILEPGALLVLNNRRCVHARSQFPAYYNGQDRWIQRMLVVESLRPSCKERDRENRRIITTDFRSWFVA